jgi:hypothetical protein
MPRPGWKHSPETRARTAAANIGRHHSIETRQKISASLRRGGKHRDKVISAGHRMAVSAAHPGKPKPLEQRERMSEAHIARRPPNLPLREVHRLERRRLYKRHRRERQRANRVQKEKK